MQKEGTGINGWLAEYSHIPTPGNANSKLGLSMAFPGKTGSHDRSLCMLSSLLHQSTCSLKLSLFLDFHWHLFPLLTPTLLFLTDYILPFYGLDILFRSFIFLLKTTTYYIQFLWVGVAPFLWASYITNYN